MKQLYLLYIYSMKDKLIKSNILRHILQCAGIFITLALLTKTGDLLHEKLLIAPFGASCIILFSFPESRFSNPRNIIGGYFICSIIGVVIYSVLGNSTLGMAFAVSLAVLVMLLTNLMHPPAGAVTIVAIATGSRWLFVLTPVVLGAFVVVTIAVVYNKVLGRIHKNMKIERLIS